MKKYFLYPFYVWKEMSLYEKILLVVSLGVSFLLAGWGIVYNVVFTYDQARDATQAYSIWHDYNIKLIGPETDIPGVFHGVLWYYILAALYLVGKTPEFVAIIFCIFTLATIYVVGLISWDLFKDKEITSVSVILYSLSPIFQTTTRWLSNPVLSFITTPFLLLFIWKYLQKQYTWYAYGIGICFGIIIQSEFAFFLLLISLPIYLLLFHIKPSVKDIMSFFIGLVMAISSFIVAEIKFRGQGIRGVVAFLHESGPKHALINQVVFIWTRLMDFFSITFFPLPAIGIVCFLGLLFILLTMFSSKQRKQIAFFLLWIALLMPFLFFRTGISTSYFLFYPFLAALIVLISFFLREICKKNIFLFLVVIIIGIGQITSNYHFLSTNTSPLPAQQGATLPLAKNVMYFTYKEAQGNPFTIITITNPLFINTTWAYLYTTYGLAKYGYLPYFGGTTQKDALGFLPEKQFGTTIRFLIIEPPIGIPDFYITQITKEEDTVSHTISVKHIGMYIVEKRILRIKKS